MPEILEIIQTLNFSPFPKSKQVFGFCRVKGHIIFVSSLEIQANIKVTMIYDQGTQQIISTWVTWKQSILKLVSGST